MAAYDELELAEAVAAGAEFMDAIDATITDEAERWFWVVNPETLDMSNDFGECGCVMAQHNPWHSYEPDLYALLGPEDVRLGFDVPSTPGKSLVPVYEALTALWVEQINERRAAWFDAHPEAVIAEGVLA